MLIEALPFSPSKGILVAVSGGSDSVALAHLLHRGGWRIALAHCHFGLRGAEADGDADFVCSLAREWALPHYETRFDTKAYAREKGISVQMAARELRYAWLEQVRVEQGYDCTATAHHLDDDIETFFINLLKGTGLRGLTGMKAWDPERRLLRPLLDKSKAEILKYIENHYLTYREDSSNAQDKYLRNKIRLHLTPLLSEMNPEWRSVFGRNLEHLRQAERLYDLGLEGLMLRLGDPYEGMNPEALRDEPALPTALWERLRPYGFSAEQIQTFLQGERTGACIESPTHRLLRDRGLWLLRPTEQNPLPELNWRCDTLSGNFVLPDELGTISWQVFDAPMPKNYDKGDPCTVYLDADSASGEWRLRPWRRGDRFQPLGMEGKSRKASDLMKDLKRSRFQKERQFVLTDSEGKIIWLLGLRADERFRVRPGTRRIMELHWSPGKGL